MVTSRTRRSSRNTWLRLLEERDRSGLTDMIDQIEAIMITVDPGSSIRYIGELALMTPYDYLVTLESKSHWTHILRVDMNSPDFLVREVKDPRTSGIFRSLNEVYPIGARKPNSRYMGEILRVDDMHGVVECQQAREFRFFSQDDTRKLELPGNLAVVKPSPYTHNIVGYMERPLDQIRVYALGISSINTEVQDVYLAAKELQKKLRIDDLILPIDHLATRIYSQNREVAILEWLSLSSYYYWGSYDISDQNSSTNVTKSTQFNSESRSPAKVFTANNTPYFVNHLERLPSPTETFVRNYGPRLHHIALAVRDGEIDGRENIEHVVSQIAAQGRNFLLDVIGSRDQGLKQIFSSASEHSSLIIEYVQRFGDFQGFFTRENVAALTHAAGVEEELLELQATRGWSSATPASTPIYPGIGHSKVQGSSGLSRHPRHCEHRVAISCHGILDLEVALPARIEVRRVSRMRKHRYLVCRDNEYIRVCFKRLTRHPSNGNKSCNQSQDRIPLRPADQGVTPHRAAAPGAAHAYADRVLLADGAAEGAFYQLAAGPLRQLPRPPDIPRAGEDTVVRGGPGRRDRGHQSVRLLRRKVCGKLSL